MNVSDLRGLQKPSACVGSSSGAQAHVWEVAAEHESQRQAHSPIRQNVAVRYNEGCRILDLTASHHLFVALHNSIAIAENGNAKTVFLIARRRDRNDAL